MPTALELVVTYAARRPWVPRRGEFARWANAAIGDAGRAGIKIMGGMADGALSVRVVGSARSRALNLRYRGKDRPTNVLSFGGAGRTPDGMYHLGELVICAPVVAAEAAAQGKTRESHWAHLTIHGVLHLLGFDHERPADARTMERREIQILDRLGFSDPYL